MLLVFFNRFEFVHVMMPEVGWATMGKGGGQSLTLDYIEKYIKNVKI